MNRRPVVLAALVVFVLLAVFAVGFGWFSSEPALTVHLRCDSDVSGTLSVVLVSKSGEPGSVARFDVETVCAQGTIEVAGYQDEQRLQFVFERGEGETVEETAEYGRDIQRDEHGFYTALKVTAAPPFLANDNI